MNKRIISLITIIGVILCSSGCKKAEEPLLTDNATNVTVSEVKKDNIAETVKYTGEIKSTSNAIVSPKVSGSIESINVDVGDYVTAGTVLMTIDSSQYKQAYDQALAAYNQALASKEIANASKEQAAASVEQAQSAKELSVAAQKQAQATKDQAVAAQKQAQAAKDSTIAAKEGAEASYTNVSQGTSEQSKINTNQAVANAQITYDNALENYNRQKSLYDIGAVSKVTLDSAKANLDSAKIALDTAKANSAVNENVIIPQAEANAMAGVKQAQSGIAQADAALEQANAAVIQAEAGLEQANANLKQSDAGITQAKAGVSQAEANITQADASIAQAKVALDIAKTNLSNCYIKAPISGYISSKKATIGQMASAGIEMFTIENTDMVDVEINVTESIISSISVGANASINIASAKLNDITATVTLISETKDVTTGMFTVKLSIPNQDKKIKVGMLADVELIINEAAEAVIVDSNSVIRENEIEYVYVAEGNKAVKKEVVTGISDGKNVEIISGLTIGEKVIIEGKEFLSDKNTEIRITE